MDWSRESAVVTGGTEGIGRAIAQELARRGAAVAVCARNAERAEQVARALGKGGRRSFGAGCDVRDETQVRAFAEQVRKGFGTPTLLVNNAGIGRFAPLTEMSAGDWDAVMETNLRGMFLMTRAFLPAMLEAHRGAIVNVASLAGKNGIVNGTAYSASKHGVLGFSKSLMLEVRKQGVRVIAVCPGSVNTAFHDTSPHNPNRDRILWAEDVAKAVADALELPERALLSELDLRPANP
jgi:3-oxoacyl-[acyl-carrier protein] reductase